MFLQNYMCAPLLDTTSLIHRLKDLGKPQEKFILGNINEFKQSKLYKEMAKSRDYYDSKNDILEKKRYYIDRQGTKREDQHLSNNKLIHPYFKKLVNQKVNYLLAKEFTLQVDEKDEQSTAFRDACSKYFDKSFMRKLRVVGKQAVINGIAWIQVYYDEKGKLNFKRIPSEEVIPFWHDADHTILDAIIRFYTIVEYERDNKTQDIVKVEYYTDEGVWFYEIRDGKLKLDTDRVTYEHPYKGHFKTQERDENGNPIVSERVWDKIPFVAFKYNDEERPLLRDVKTLIDNYDRVTSDTADLIQDIPNSIKVVKGYGGSDKGEFSQNLATYRTVFVDEAQGGVDLLTSEADTTCTEAHLTRLKEDIYEAGNGVNIQKESLSTTSGVALKIRYADLDSDCMAMGNNFAAALENLCWFIQVDLTSQGEKIDYEKVEFDILFNCDGIINETDVVMNCKNSVGVISNETIIANHPWVTDLPAEMERLKEQQEEEMELQLENEQFGINSVNKEINRKMVQGE